MRALEIGDRLTGQRARYSGGMVGRGWHEPSGSARGTVRRQPAIGARNRSMLSWRGEARRIAALPGVAVVAVACREPLGPWSAPSTSVKRPSGDTLPFEMWIQLSPDALVQFTGDGVISFGPMTMSPALQLEHRLLIARLSDGPDGWSSRSG
jgi:hypothetical protein